MGRFVPVPLRLIPLEPPRGHGNAAILDEKCVSEFAEETATYIQCVCELAGLSIQRIAIDAPSVTF
jgi:hypothetical protein